MIITVEDFTTGAIVPALEFGIRGMRDFRWVWDGENYTDHKTGDHVAKKPERFGIGNWYRYSRIEAWETQGVSIGSPWPFYNLDEVVYQAIKESIYDRAVDNDDLLRFDGAGAERLYPSFVDEWHPEHIHESEKEFLDVGSAVPYARNHALGVGEAPEHLGGAPIPQRNMLPLGITFIMGAQADLGHAAGELGKHIEHKTDDIRRRLEAAGQL